MIKGLEANHQSVNHCRHNLIKIITEPLVCYHWLNSTRSLSDLLGFQCVKYSKK